MFVHLNGRLVPADQARVSVFDGGYTAGDGVYTTLRLYAGRPLDLPAHWARLARQTAALEIPFPLDEAGLRRAVAELAERNGLTDGDGRLRITVSRGGSPDDPLPLTRLAAIPSTVVMTLVPVAPALAEWAADGIPVVVLDDAYARGSFPHLKTLNGLAAVSALRRAAAAGCPEALLTGPDGRLLEGAVSNIFVVRDGRLATPTVGDGFLAGRTRERILGLAAGLGLPAGEAVLRREDLAAAAEVFVVSSVREVLPVVRIDTVPVGDGRPGPVTRRIQAAYRELIDRALVEDSGA
ncbi:aminotransferase class IV [bacterium]|nr:aminotransferase class IV [bacterium]